MRARWDPPSGHSHRRLPDRTSSAGAYAAGWIAERLAPASPAAVLLGALAGAAALYAVGAAWLTIFFLRGDLPMDFLPESRPSSWSTASKPRPRRSFPAPAAKAVIQTIPGG